MTSREIIERAMHFEHTPRIPVTVLTGVTWTIKRQGLSPYGMLKLPDQGAKMLVDAMDEIGSDIVFGARVSPYVLIRAMGGTVVSDIEGAPTAITKKPLEKLSDINRIDLDEVAEKLAADEENQLMLEQTRKMRTLLGDSKFLAVGGFAPFTMASQMVGMTEMLEAIFDEDEDVEKLMKFATEIVCRFTKPYLEAGGDMIYIADPVSSGDLISPAMYEEYALPPLKEMTARFAPDCPNILFHICGNTMARIRPLTESGISTFSMDSLDLKEALEKADRKIAIMGNLNPANVLASKSPEEIYEISSKLCRTAGLEGGFWLGPGCDLAPDTPLENLQAMVKAAHDFNDGRKDGER